MPGRVQHHIGLVGEGARDAVDLRAGKDFLQGAPVLGDLHRYAVDVEREGHEPNTGAESLVEIGRPGLGLVPSQLVQDVTYAVSSVNLSLLDVFDLHVPLPISCPVLQACPLSR